MKRIKSNANMNSPNTNLNQLLQPLPETTQQTVSGGASDYLLELDGVKGESKSSSATKGSATCHGVTVLAWARVG